MLKHISLIALMLLLMSSNLFSQTLTVGNNISFERGTIQTDVLLGIIEKKQEELKKRILHDLTIRAFNKTDSLDRSFAVYQYLYELLDVVINEKNKTVATKLVLQNMLRFAIIYKLEQYYWDKYRNKQEIKQVLELWKVKDNYTNSDTVVKRVQDGFDGVPSEVDEKVTLTEEYKYRIFFLMMDIVYDMLRDNSGDSFVEAVKDGIDSVASVNIQALITAPAKDKSFLSWYNNDNLYLKLKRVSGSTISAAVADLRRSMQAVLVEEVKNVFYEDSVLAKLMKGVLKGKLNMNRITKDQVIALFDILDYMSDKFQYTTSNLTLLSVITKTLRRQVDINEITLADDSTAVGSVSLNLESVILELSSNYINPNRRSFSVPTSSRWVNVFKPRFFLKMGVNSGRFLGSNTLAKDTLGSPIKLNEVYYASEKIGLQFNFWNWGYTHSFKHGEPFKFRGNYVKWKRPQPDPFFYRLHLEAYLSGLLYNLANLKTSKDFNYMVAGVNLGCTFFNGLSASVGIATPLSVNSSRDNHFLNASVDIPIVEYLSALTKK